MPEQLSGVLITGLRRALRREPLTKTQLRRLRLLGLIETASEWSRLTPAGLEALRAASRTEALEKAPTP